MINSEREWNWMNDKRKTLAIIPARWGSTRLPGKPLADINGKPMVQWVYEAVQKSKADKVIVATDSFRIIDAVNKFSGEAVMTSEDHATGTDRILEAYEGYKDEYDFVINVQGDEPIINENDINTMIAQLKNGIESIVTLIGQITPKQCKDRNTVKAIIENGKVAMFTRSPLYIQSNTVKRHIGIYGFTKAVLSKISRDNMDQTRNEFAENLEQLRWCDNGIRIGYSFAAGLYKGIDTQEDLDFVRTYLN